MCIDEALHAGLLRSVGPAYDFAHAIVRHSLYDALNPYQEGKPPANAPVRPKKLTTTEFADPGLGDLSAADCVFLCDVPRFSRRVPDAHHHVLCHHRFDVAWRLRPLRRKRCQRRPRESPPPRLRRTSKNPVARDRPAGVIGISKQSPRWWNW